MTAASGTFPKKTSAPIPLSDRFVSVKLASPQQPQEEVSNDEPSVGGFSGAGATHLSSRGRRVERHEAPQRLGIGFGVEPWPLQGHYSRTGPRRCACAPTYHSSGDRLGAIWRPLAPTDAQAQPAHEQATGVGKGLPVFAVGEAAHGVARAVQQDDHVELE